jgi:glucans biosynthesis protein C
LLNRPFRWLPYANEAVLPWYILHQSMIVAIAFVLVPLRIGPMLEPLAVIAGTIAGYALLYECLIHRSAVLRLLFSLKLRPEAATRINPSPVPAFPLSSDHD